MSPTQTGGDRLTGPVKDLLDQWAASLAKVLESMADRRPEISWRELDGTAEELGIPSGPGHEEEMLWWEQPFSFSPGARVWVGSPRPTWEHMGTITLRAAGLERVEPGEARSTWFEILGQSLSEMARGFGARLGREVTCTEGRENPPDTTARGWASISLTFADTALSPLFLHLDPKLIAALVSPPSTEPEPKGDPAAAERPTEVQETGAAAGSRTMELLMDVDLPVSISFGKAKLPLKDVLKLTTGSIVELNRGINEPVEILVNERLVARGEIVVVDGNYAVRIQEIATRQDRLRSIR